MEVRINKTSFYSKTINLERRQLIYPSVTPRYTSIREHLRSPAVFIFSLFFSPPFFSLLLLLSPPSLFSFTAHKVRVVLEHWFSTRPVPKRPISRVSPSYIHRSRGKGIRAAETCDAVRHPSSDITSFRLLHRIDQPHHRLPTVDFQPSLSSRDYRLLREHSSARFVNTLLGRGARIEVRGGEVGGGEVGGGEVGGDEVTNNIELTLVGDSKFNGWKTKHVSF